MPTNVVPNLSGKCMNTLTFLKAVEPKWQAIKITVFSVNGDFFRREKLLLFLALPLLFKELSVEFCQLLLFMKMLY